MTESEPEDLDFDYFVRQGSHVHIIRYDSNGVAKDKASLNLADTMKFHVDDFVASFKDTISGSIFMRFAKNNESGFTSLTTEFQNVFTVGEDGSESECFFFDDDVDEIIAYQFTD